MNFYFRYPIFVDLIVAVVVAIAMKLLFTAKYLILPEENQVLSLTSDIANISLTSAGFVLTLLTVLITFKSTSRVTKESKTDEHSVFEIFFATKLYGQTVQLLKNCVISLLILSLCGYSLKLIVSGGNFTETDPTFSLQTDPTFSLETDPTFSV